MTRCTSRARHGLQAALLALWGLTFSGTVAAQWKWRDASGQVQYSDLPPPPYVSEKNILQKPQTNQRAAVAAPEASSAEIGNLPASAASAASVPAQVAPAKPAEPELEARRRKAEQEKVAKQKAEEVKAAAVRADNCSRARTQLRSLDSGARIATINAKGEREVMDDKARNDETRRVRSVIASDCK